jgi:hypothetical protein
MNFLNSMPDQERIRMSSMQRLPKYLGVLFVALWVSLPAHGGDPSVPVQPKLPPGTAPLHFHIDAKNNPVLAMPGDHITVEVSCPSIPDRKPKRLNNVLVVERDVSDSTGEADFTIAVKARVLRETGEVICPSPGTWRIIAVNSTKKRTTSEP